MRTIPPEVQNINPFTIPKTGRTSSTKDGGYRASRGVVQASGEGAPAQQGRRTKAEARAEPEARAARDTQVPHPGDERRTTTDREGTRKNQDGDPQTASPGCFGSLRPRRGYLVPDI